MFEFFEIAPDWIQHCKSSCPMSSAQLCDRQRQKHEILLLKLIKSIRRRRNEKNWQLSSVQVFDRQRRKQRDMFCFPPVCTTTIFSCCHLYIDISTIGSGRSTLRYQLLCTKAFFAGKLLSPRFGPVALSLEGTSLTNFLEYRKCRETGKPTNPLNNGKFRETGKQQNQYSRDFSNRGLSSFFLQCNHVFQFLDILIHE